MSQIRARLAALRARREHQVSSPAQVTAPAQVRKIEPVDRRHSLGAHTASYARLEWREKARRAASERVRRAALDSGVYEVITRPLPQEKDDIEELEKRKLEEAEENAEEEEQEEDAEDVEEEDEEEAALERLERGIVSDAYTRDADTRDADTRDADTRDADTRDTDTLNADTRDADPHVGTRGTRDADTRDADARHVDASSQVADDSSTVPNGKEPDSAPTDPDKLEKNADQQQPVEGEGGKKPIQGDEERPISETSPSVHDPKPAPISETGPEAFAPPIDPQDIMPQAVTPQDAKPENFTPPRNTLSMVEDEAEDDEDHERDENGSPDLSGNELDDIVPDADIAEADAAKLAEFHRKWEAEQMEAAAPRYDDLDDAMDFTDVKAGGDDGVCAEGGDNPADRAENYIDAMFLREDSKSKVVDIAEEDDAGDETTREKARALWKARQEFRTHLRERDESNSLSRFDLFNNSQNRSADIRSRLEKSCCPAPLRDVTNLDKNKKRKLEPPEWARRKEILAQKERKRRRAVSVGNWSFAMHGKREEVAVKKTSTRPSLGAAHLTKRSRTRKAATPPRRRPPVAAVPKRGTGVTSFKGLLSVLGKQATVDRSQ